MAVDPWASTNQGLGNLSNTLASLAQLKRQDEQQVKQNRLVDLQTQAAQQGLDDQTALRSALSTAKGGYLYPEPAGVGPMQAGAETTLSSLAPQAQPADAQDRLNVMADLASKGNSAAMEMFGKAESLTQKLAEHKAQAEIYGDAEGAAKAKLSLDKMKTAGDALENWMKVDPSGELARQNMAANPDIFNGMDPSKMQLGDGKKTPPVFFPVADGGFTFYDGKEWKHVKKDVDKSVTEFEAFMQAGKSSGKNLQTILSDWNTQEIERKKAGATRVSTNVVTKEQTEEAKTVGKGQGERYNDLVKQGDTGFRQKTMYTRLESLLDGVETGKLTPTGTQIAAVASSVGIDIDKNLGNKQAAVALANQLALELRNPAGGAGMPGALSDSDRNFLMASVPGLSQTPQGNKLMIQYAKAMAQRSMDVSKLATEYRKKHGTLDTGFNDELQVWADANPVFDEKGNARTDSAVRKAGGGGTTGIPQAAISHLKQNPKLRAAFDQKYGKGAAAKVLGR